jgi:hypothetical protein
MLPSDEDQKGWTVEQTKAAIAKLKGVPENLEEWFSTETPANLVSGALRVKDIADMIKLVEEARAKITKTGSHTDQFIIALDAALHDQRPGKVSKVAVLCNSLIDDQAKQKAEDERLRREVEKAAADEAAQALQEGEEIEARARRRYQFVSLEERRELDESTKAALLPPHRRALRSVISTNKKAARSNGRSGVGTPVPGASTIVRIVTRATSRRAAASQRLSRIGLSRPSNLGRY